MSLNGMLARYGKYYDVYRLIATTGSKKKYTKVATILALIEPMSANAAQINQMSFTRAYEGYTSRSSNVLIGDYLQDPASAVKYDMQGARDYNIGSQPLFQLVLQRQVQQGQLS